MGLLDDLVIPEPKDYGEEYEEKVEEFDELILEKFSEDTKKIKLIK